MFPLNERVTILCHPVWSWSNVSGLISFAPRKQKKSLAQFFGRMKTAALPLAAVATKGPLAASVERKQKETPVALIFNSLPFPGGSEEFRKV